MQTIYDFIIFAYKIEYYLEHDSKVLLLNSIPKILTAKGYLYKR